MDKLKQVTAVNPFEEQRRLAAENKAKDPKKKGPEETEEADLKKQQSLEALIEELTFEKKDISYIPVLFKSVLELVDAPVYPDPNTLPVPEPVFH